MKTRSMIRSMVFGMALLAVGTASFADEYSCKVYCVAGSGKTEPIQVTVNASSSSDAAAYVDDKADKACREEGYVRATSSTMSSSQCTRN